MWDEMQAYVMVRQSSPSVARITPDWAWSWTLLRREPVDGNYRRMDVIAEGYAPSKELAESRALSRCARGEA